MSFSGFAPGLKLLIIKARIFVFLSVSVVVLSFCHLSYCHILFYLANYILNYFVPFLFLTSVLLVITSLVFKSLSSPLYSSVCLLCFPKLSPVSHVLFCFVPYEVFVVLYPFRFLICPCLRLVFVATCLSVSCIFFARIYYCLLYQSLTSLPNLPPVVSLFLPDLASHFHFVRLWGWIRSTPRCVDAWLTDVSSCHIWLLRLPFAHLCIHLCTSGSLEKPSLSKIRTMSPWCVTTEVQNVWFVTISIFCAPHISCKKM